MAKVVQIGGRQIEWVSEEPGPILILIVAFVFILSAACLPSQTDAPERAADVSATR